MRLGYCCDNQKINNAGVSGAMKKYSILDLCPVCEGNSMGDAFENCIDLAKNVERFGYNRIWLAEHHNMAGIASAATSVVIGQVANATQSIRVGAGGVMLSNHSPLIIAEQFGTLESLFPGRVDLGVGRAPGSDGLTARAIRRGMNQPPDNFLSDLGELLAFLSSPQSNQRVQAFPGVGTNVPVWILGSSLFGAQVAASMGLPYAFASHFAPELLVEALTVYRKNFCPSETLSEPYVIAGLNFFAADSDEKAKKLFTSLQIQFANLFRGVPGKLQPPVDNIQDYVSLPEMTALERALKYSVIGSYDTVLEKTKEFLNLTSADELILTAQIFEHRDRLESFEIGATVCTELVEESSKEAA